MSTNGETADLMVREGIWTRRPSTRDTAHPM